MRCGIAACAACAALGAGTVRQWTDEHAATLRPTPASLLSSSRGAAALRLLRRPSRIRDHTEAHLQQARVVVAHAMLAMAAAAAAAKWLEAGQRLRRNTLHAPTARPQVRPRLRVRRLELQRGLVVPQGGLRDGSVCQSDELRTDANRSSGHSSGRRETYTAVYAHLGRPSEAGAGAEAGLLPARGVPARKSVLPSVHA